MKASEKKQLSELGTRELVAYGNILTMSRKCLHLPGGRERNERHLGLVREILDARK